MQTVDDLNLKHGIAYQDVAGRNLIVDPATNMVLIDFNVSCRVGAKKNGRRDQESLWKG